MEKIHEFLIPIRTISEANTSEHWSKKSVRKKKQAYWVRIFMKGSSAQPPCHIKLTRIAPRRLDDDNNTMALKYVRDAIADQINPGLAPGRADDSCHGITWEYDQEKGIPKSYGVKIEIFK